MQFVINKIDSSLSRDNIYDFYELGFSEYLTVSGEQNIGIYELLTTIVKDFPKVEEEYKEGIIKLTSYKLKFIE